MKQAGSYKKLLVQPSFVSFLITQFITAFNDNAFKTVVMLIALLAPKDGYVDKYYIAAQLVFTLPYLFSGYAGYFSDRYAKNKVIVATKVLEIFVMLLALYFLARENKTMLVFVLFLLSTHSVFLSPAKYGILPEWFDEEDISRVNGMVELLTFIAIILGSAIGGILMQHFGSSLPIIGVVLLSLSVIGLFTSLGLKSVPVSDPSRIIKMNPWHEISEGIKVMWENRLLATTIAGISFFFAMGLAVMTNVMVFGKEIFSLTETQLGLVSASLGMGIGIGSITAGWLSGDKIEYGLIPMGALGMTACMFGVAFNTTSLLTLYCTLAGVGYFAGLFIVPLNALLQELPASHIKGRLIATNNFFNGMTMLSAVLLIWFLQGALHLRPDSIMLVLAWITLMFSVITLILNPRFFLRFIIWIIIHIFYRVDIVGSPRIPKSGPALIVSNHVSYIDGLVLSTAFPRFLRYLVHKTYYEHPMLNALMRFAYAIPIESGSEEKVNASIALARKALQEGHVVCIFAEGRLTRTGNLLPFRTGLEKIIEGLDVPIIPVHLDQLWDTFFSPRKENQFFRMPQQFPARITVTLGEPMPSSSKAWEVRQAVQELAVEARISGYQREHYLSVKFLQTATAYPYRPCIYDQETHTNYKYATFSSKALVIANKLKKVHSHEHRVGVFLPKSYKSILLNTALVLAGKSVVNIPLHYTYAQILELKKRLGIINIYTHFDEKYDANYKDMIGNHLIAECHAIDVEVLFACCHKPSSIIKLKIIGFLKYVIPVKYVVKFIGHLPSSHEVEVGVVISENNDTEIPEVKYIKNSHESLYNNVSGIKQIMQFSATDKIASFVFSNQAFALIADIWSAFIVGCSVIPIDGQKSIEENIKLVYKHKVNFLIVEKEFLSYCLENLAVNLLGYAKLIVCIDEVDEELIEQFYDKFSLRVMLGFGLPELGPVVSMNTPNVRSKGMLQRGSKRGSLGHPLPNVAFRIVQEDSGEVLPPGEEGLLEIKTAAHMSGYVNSAMEIKNRNKYHLDANVDSWFKTNRLAVLDEEGFLFILK